MKRRRNRAWLVVMSLGVASLAGTPTRRALGQIGNWGFQPNTTPQAMLPADNGVGAPVVAVPPQFRDALSPYGQWLNVPAWGWCWRPSVTAVGVGFRPYVTGGRWVATTDGWSFNTAWVWGWAPFHYGRWLYREGEGWLWLPGSAWGPSWVSWRFGAGYVGWAPLGPPGFRWPREGFTPWSFASVRHFTSPALITHVNMYPDATRRFFALTRAVTTTITVGSVRWNVGPSPRAFARYGVHVKVVARPRPGSIRINPAPRYGRNVRPYHWR